MRTVIAVVLALSTTGCATAVMVKNPYPWTANAPANRASEVGTVAYKSRKVGAIADAGRFSSYKLMGQACRGRDYVLVDDPYYVYPRGNWAWQQFNRDQANGIAPANTYLDFQCVAY